MCVQEGAGSIFAVFLRMRTAPSPEGNGDGLPTPCATGAPVRPLPRPPALRMRPSRVLIADDSATNRRMLKYAIATACWGRAHLTRVRRRRALERHGASVAAVSSGAECLQAFGIGEGSEGTSEGTSEGVKRHAFDLVILDKNMHGMDGLSTAR